MPTPTRPWRRDAWRWAVKYGAVIGGVFFLYHRYIRYNLLGRIPLFEGIFEDLRTGVLWALFGGIVIFIVRWRGSLLDLDELEEGGRGGLGLHRARRAESQEPPSEGSAS